ncbi:MAG: ATP-dependent DNA helicase, partial [Myxococcaceae bacterium]|nr:ATP-dependent DNA helicase [Myxococcaceae bacterium]
HELQGRLYGAVDTAVFTSATLTAEGRFDFFAQRLGLLDAESGESVAPLLQVNVASPFDYTRQAALYVPSHLPEPSEPGFAEAVAEELVALTEVTGGRAFALFTSLRNMEAVWALTRDRLPYQVLLQGELPKAALLEAFREKPSVLFAAHSFWEGVDVPGDALSLVVIDRLPFASPGEPLVAARIHRLTERGLSPFSAYQLPQAAISLRQGFGRLIRTREDRGVVAVLDRRLRTKAYGKSFLRSLPRTQRFGERDALAHWFQAT